MVSGPTDSLSKSLEAVHKEEEKLTELLQTHANLKAMEPKLLSRITNAVIGVFSSKVSSKASEQKLNLEQAVKNIDNQVQILNEKKLGLIKAIEARISRDLAKLGSEVDELKPGDTKATQAMIEKIAEQSSLITNLREAAGKFDYLDDIKHLTESRQKLESKLEQKMRAQVPARPGSSGVQKPVSSGPPDRPLPVVPPRRPQPRSSGAQTAPSVKANTTAPSSRTRPPPPPLKQAGPPPRPTTPAPNPSAQSQPISRPPHPNQGRTNQCSKTSVDRSVPKIKTEL